MYIVRSGLLNTVLSPEQYEMLKNGVITTADIEIEDTIRQYKNEDGEVVDYLPFKICYRDVDKHGKDKYIFNEEKNEYQPSYFYSPVIYAYGKELRILLELGIHAPIKVVYKEQWNDGDLYRTAICIQDQKTGTLND